MPLGCCYLWGLLKLTSCKSELTRKDLRISLKGNGIMEWNGMIRVALWHQGLLFKAKHGGLNEDFFFLSMFACLFLAAQIFTVVQGLFFVTVLRLLTAMASLARHTGFSSCDTQAELPRGMWDLPGPGIESVSVALASGFLTTGPPEKPSMRIFT